MKLFKEMYFATFSLLGPKFFYKRWWYKTFGVKWCLVWSHMHIWGVCVMTSPVTARISKIVNFDRHRPFLGGRFDEGIWPTSGFWVLLPSANQGLSVSTAVTVLMRVEAGFRRINVLMHTKWLCLHAFDTAARMVAQMTARHLLIVWICFTVAQGQGSKNSHY